MWSLILYYSLLWQILSQIVNYVENMNIEFMELLFFLTPLNGIYGKHTAPCLENIILLITEIKYFTSFYQVRVVLMFIGATY